MLLERAVANLIDNALFFSPCERPGAGRSGGRWAATLHLRVIDAGPGIPVADRERVFQPFQRLGDNPNGAGVGLGLAVAKGFVNAVGGELVIEDTPGGGCTMVITIPIDRSMTRLLLIDDEAPFVRAMGVSLRAMGYDVDAAPSGAAGLAKAATTTPDVIVLDLGLPDMDGLEVLNGSARMDGGAGDRAVRHGTATTPRSPRSTAARTTTSPSRSAWTSCWRASAPRCAGVPVR